MMRARVAVMKNSRLTTPVLRPHSLGSWPSVPIRERIVGVADRMTVDQRIDAVGADIDTAIAIDTVGWTIGGDDQQLDVAIRRKLGRFTVLIENNCNSHWLSFLVCSWRRVRVPFGLISQLRPPIFTQAFHAQRHRRHIRNATENTTDEIFGNATKRKTCE
jgi:hypothetical protein